MARSRNQRIHATWTSRGYQITCWRRTQCQDWHIHRQFQQESCEAGYKVIFDADECRVYYKDNLVLLGGKDKTTALWKLPINPTTNQMHNQQGLQLKALDFCSTNNAYTISLHTQQANMHSAYASLYTLPYKQNQLKYMHQSFFNAPLQMLIDASLNNQLTGVPFINNPDFIQKYLAPSTATPKGRMKKPKAGIRSTRKIVKDRRARKLGMELSDSGAEEEISAQPTMQSPTIIPNDAPQANSIFCYAPWPTSNKAHCTQMPQEHSQKYSSTANNILVWHTTMTPSTLLHSQLQMCKMSPASRQLIKFSPN